MKRTEVRSVDRIAMDQFGMSGLVLMENAGRGAARRIARWLHADAAGDHSKIRILCGTGNNGGDGYVIARHLQLFGFSVEIVSLVPLENLGGDAEANAQIAVRSEIPFTVARDAESLDEILGEGDVMIDCLLGTGAKGEPRGLYADAVRRANATDGVRIAIDIPTGLDCDTGAPSGSTFRADLTITFVATKDGFGNPAAVEFLGEVQVAGIGVPKALLDRFGVDAAD